MKNMFCLIRAQSFSIVLLSIFGTYYGNEDFVKFKLNFDYNEMSQNQLEQLTAVTVATDENQGLMNLLNSAYTNELLYNVSKDGSNTILSKVPSNSPRIFKAL